MGSYTPTKWVPGAWIQRMYLACKNKQIKKKTNVTTRYKRKTIYIGYKFD